jgi:broad specificity phosphatase PhoE
MEGTIKAKVDGHDRRILGNGWKWCMMRIYCVRHGESVYNAEGRIQGQADVMLSDLGLRQGEAVAHELQKICLDAIYSSPLVRAKQTAEILAERVNLPIRFDDRLKEIDAGIFQHQRRVDLEVTHPEELQRWRSEDLDYVIPGGESRRQLMQRGCEAMWAVAANEHRHVAVVAHGRLLVVTIKCLVGLEPHAPPISLENGSITTLAFDGGGFRVERWNQSDHLLGVGLAGQGDL